MQKTTNKISFCNFEPIPLYKESPMRAVVIIRNNLKMIWVTSYTPENIQERGAAMIFWKSWILNHPNSSASDCSNRIFFLGNPQLAKEKILSIFHHVANSHSFPAFAQFRQCCHEELTDCRPWIKPGNSKIYHSWRLSIQLDLSLRNIQKGSSLSPNLIWDISKLVRLSPNWSGAWPCSTPACLRILTVIYKVALLVKYLGWGKKVSWSISFHWDIYSLSLLPP